MVTPLLNREIGILEFNSRVLSQAEDPQNPLLERLRFLSIVSNNLDEFFEVRVSGLKEQLLSQPLKLEPDGLTIHDCYQRVAEYSHQLVARQYEIYQKVIIPQLATAGIRFLRREDWSVQQRRWALEFFRTEILPLLTPIALDPAHPFPRVGNKSLNFIVSLTGKDAFGREANLAVVQAPRALPRVIQIPKRISECEYSFVLLSSLVQSFVAELFPGLDILQAHAFRVTRNSELFVSDDEATDLREALQGELPT
ncbi:MAG: RNA degradosome polyphosphate kinase, partial [Burkholderiaceae bacterium]|nr:RNA degradosome polyphosphate kinase [Burkholderiaceae bacterium]